MKKLLITALCAAATALSAQTVSIYAGKQYVGEFGDNSLSGGIAQLNDSFSRPFCVGLDTTGKMWVTDQHAISILWAGKSYFRAGFYGRGDDMDAMGYFDGASTSVRFADPHGIAVHPKTNDAYLTDNGQSTVRKVGKFVNLGNTTVVSTIAGKPDISGGSYKDGTTVVNVGNDDYGTARFSSPEDIVVASDGTIYVADSYNDCIRKISGGQVTTIAGKGLTPGDKVGDDTAARFEVPFGLFLESDNSLLIADRNNGKIKRLNLSTKKVSTVVSGLFLPTDVVSVNGNLYIADANCIYKWDGTSLTVFAGKYRTAGFVDAVGTNARFGELGLINYRASDASIYIADVENNCIRRLLLTAPAVADFVADKTAVSVNDVVRIRSLCTNAGSVAWVLSSGYTLVNGSKLTDTVIFVTYAATGSYNVSITAYSASGNDTKLRNNYINVSLLNTKPVPDFYADILNPSISQTVSFVDQSTDNPTSWEWTFTPNTVTYQNSTTSTDRFPKVKFNAIGKYTVSLKVSNTNGNDTKTKTDYITVVANGISDIANAQLALYPNPAGNTLYLINAPTGKIAVSDLNGKEYAVAVNGNQIDVSALSAGIYVVKVVSAEGAVSFGKFVKSAN